MKFEYEYKIFVSCSDMLSNFRFWGSNYAKRNSICLHFQNIFLLYSTPVYFELWIFFS